LVHTRHDLTDDQWVRLEPLLPDRTPQRGGRWVDHRQIIDGVMWRTRAGCTWRDLPSCYGNWKTVYNRHRRWSGDGTWRMVLDELRSDCDRHDDDELMVSVDSTVIRAHHHAAGARHLPPRDIPAEVFAPAVLEDSETAASDTGGAVE
jgi:transposase